MIHLKGGPSPKEGILAIWPLAWTGNGMSAINKATRHSNWWSCAHVK